MNYTDDVYRLGFAVRQLTSRRVFLMSQAIEASECGYEVEAAELRYEAADLNDLIKKGRKKLTKLMNKSSKGHTVH